jgi:uncharacterized spore protein YtfJ
MANEVQVRPEMQQEIDRAVRGQSGAIVEKLAERLRGAANAAAVYGTPVVRDGVTVIPVAKVRWGFGGGGGTGTTPGDKGSGSGEGGGGGVLATPMGYIEMRDGSTEFRQINDPMTLLIVPPIIIASGITAMLVLRGLRLLFRR